VRIPYYEKIEITALGHYQPVSVGHAGKSRSPFSVLSAMLRQLQTVIFSIVATQITATVSKILCLAIAIAKGGKVK